MERQGKIVTRQEIRRILWPNDTVVDFDRSINVAMAILRKALGDDAEQPKYIETLPRRGYRLIAPVEWQQSSTEGTPRKSYEEFLTLWRNADPDLPAYKQAKAESAALAKTHSS